MRKAGDKDLSQGLQVHTENHREGTETHREINYLLIYLSNDGDT
jgi:hypothetical protein